MAVALDIKAPAAAAPASARPASPAVRNGAGNAGAGAGGAGGGGGGGGAGCGDGLAGCFDCAMGGIMAPFNALSSCLECRGCRHRGSGLWGCLCDVLFTIVLLGAIIAGCIAVLYGALFVAELVVLIQRRNTVGIGDFMAVDSCVAYDGVLLRHLLFWGVAMAPCYLLLLCMAALGLRRDGSSPFDQCFVCTAYCCGDQSSDALCSTDWDRHCDRAVDRCCCGRLAAALFVCCVCRRGCACGRSCSFDGCFRRSTTHCPREQFHAHRQAVLNFAPNSKVVGRHDWHNAQLQCPVSVCVLALLVAGEAALLLVDITALALAARHDCDHDTAYAVAVWSVVARGLVASAAIVMFLRDVFDTYCDG